MPLGWLMSASWRCTDAIVADKARDRADCGGICVGRGAKPADTAILGNTRARTAGGTTAKSNGLTWIRINGI